MSLLKVNAVQIGQSATAANNFGFAVPAVPDGSIRLQRGNVGAAIEDLLTISAAGILSAGYNPSTGLRSTALATMQKFADEFTASTAVNGWQKLPSGIIMQWGTVLTSASADTTVTYPTVFPNAARSVVGTCGTAFDISFVTNGTTTTSFLANAISAGGRNAITCSWIAFGY